VIGTRSRKRKSRLLGVRYTMDDHKALKQRPKNRDKWCAFHKKTIGMTHNASKISTKNSMDWPISKSWTRALIICIKKGPDI